MLTMPPRAAGDVCSICRSWRKPGYAVCWNCQTAADQLGAAVPVISVSIYSKPSVLREWLTFYKPSRGVENPEYRQSLREAAAVFLETYADELTADFGPFDLAVPVPSGGGALGAVADVIGPSVESLLAPVEEIVTLAPGAHVRAGHYSDSWFTVSRNVEGTRIVMLDDVYASGARAQSASAALRKKGADVTLIIVIGRRINPEFCAEASALWKRQSSESYHLSESPYWR